jgi:hypothetical protein
MTAGDKDDILHLLDPKANSIGKREAPVDILAYPHRKITESNGVEPSCRERKIQQGAFPGARKLELIHLDRTKPIILEYYSKRWESVKRRNLTYRDL